MAVARLIGELNTRFSASRDADPAEYAARVQLLAEDLSDIEPRWLDAAIRIIANQEDYLPTARKVRKAAVEAQDAARPTNREQERIELNQRLIAEANAKLAAEGAKVRWHAKGDGPWTLSEPRPQLDPSAYDRSTWRVRPDEVAAMNALYTKAGSCLRYLPDGSTDPKTL